jgi:hypothetical protein
MIMSQYVCLAPETSMTVAMTCDDDNESKLHSTVNWLEANKAQRSRLSARPDDRERLL